MGGFTKCIFTKKNLVNISGVWRLLYSVLLLWNLICFFNKILINKFFIDNKYACVMLVIAAQGYLYILGWLIRNLLHIITIPLHILHLLHLGNNNNWCLVFSFYSVMFCMFYSLFIVSFNILWKYNSITLHVLKY